MTKSSERADDLVTAVPVDSAESFEFWVQARRQYHRTLFWISSAVLVVALLLAPPKGNALRLPLLDVPTPDVCVWKASVGFDCPGCGLTRCFICMAHGQWAAAWAFHPVGTFLFVCVAAQPPYRLWQMRRLARGKDEYRSRWIAAVPWAFVVALLGQWTWRMVEQAGG